MLIMEMDNLEIIIKNKVKVVDKTSELRLNKKSIT
jgi:hypothetical protein